MIRKKKIPPPPELEAERLRLLDEWRETVSDIAPEEELPPDRDPDLYITTHCSDALLPYVGAKRPKGWKRPKK